MTLINGFSISSVPSRIGVKTYRVPGTNVLLPVRSEVAPLLIGFAAEFHRTVEPLRAGWCWGYAYRAVRGYSTPSFHSGGLAIDLNAPRHPLGRSGTFNARQREQINRLCKKYGLRWGGNYRYRKDEMHVEVILPRSQAIALARRIQEGSARSFPNIDKLKFGKTNRHVKALQRRLKEKNLRPGVVDGHFGPKTRGAVTAFQIRQGWRGADADGAIGPATYRRLFGKRP